ncbi:helix-turn-helix domain-containing protein [Aureimonas psammosilenae]|uniref:helix-turn-helix domain-containing protein n=1 Tax=Aureimonas psammosilenae TaxID=2495496 RepID=UPI0012608886|nr:helix-turn-helix transcriptional regulator [Aureimonas psammosilenae]
MTGSELREVRLHAGHTQREFGVRLGYRDGRSTEVLIGRLEREERILNPRFTLLVERTFETPNFFAAPTL